MNKSIIRVEQPDIHLEDEAPEEDGEEHMEVDAGERGDDLGREGREEIFGQSMVRGEIWAEKGGRRYLGRAW